MKAKALLINALLVLGAGCSWQGSPPAPIGSDRMATEAFSARRDSVASLLAGGLSQDYLREKVRLKEDIRRYLSLGVPAVQESLLNVVLTELEDSSSVGEDYSHRYLAETDSVALSLRPWPEEPEEPLRASLGGGPFPIVQNKQIQFWIDYFTGPGRKRFQRALTRMQTYRPTVERILRELDVPPDLAVVPLIESGYSMKARSRARAVGPWQFIAGTARLYGLRVNWWIDERRDVVAATYAAGHYLRDLYSLWESWLLALAAYNAGEYRVAMAVVRQKSKDFWKLRLPRQTRRYVPKFLAALYLARDPSKYGFDEPTGAPLAFDEVTVKEATDLSLIAKLAGCSREELRRLNPALLRWCTPPGAEVAVKVPSGRGAIVEAKLRAIPPEKRITWRRHRIRRGETLIQIARRYGTSVYALKKLNGIRNSHLIRAGKSLIVPVRRGYAVAASSKPSYRKKKRNLSKEQVERKAKRSLAPPGYKRVYYMVRDGETLGEIAERFHTSARYLRRWNNLSRRSFIYPGQRLAVYVPPSFDLSHLALDPPPPSPHKHVRRSYVVRKGDTLSSISRRFNVKVSDLLVWNKKRLNSVLRPGEKLEIWQQKD